MEKPTRPTRQTLDNLPSLPQVLLKILDAVTNDSADFQSLVKIIRQDTAIATRLISIANSSYYRRQHSCDSVDRALMYLGIETVKTLVITTTVKQYFNHFNQRHQQFMRQFWFRSLVSANTAQVLASLTSYNAPSEAYLCGLLLDVGQLCLLTDDDKTYHPILVASAEDDQQLLSAERKALSMTHCEVGASLLDGWALDNFMAEAVRHHHEPAARIQQSHHLVKIINLASELSAHNTPSEAALAKANQLFGLNEDLVIELRYRIAADVRKIADNMGISIDEEGSAQADILGHQKLGEKLSEISQLQNFRQSLQLPRNAEALQSDIQRSLYLSFGIERYVVFMHNSALNTLEARISANASTPDFVIDNTIDDNLVHNCFVSQHACSSETRTTPELSITDQQLLNYCRQPFLLCMPFAASNRRGVLVAGADRELLKQQRQKPAFWQNLLNDVGHLFIASLPASSATAEPSEDSRRISEAVHEVSNPLSIINNYLEMLRIKLGSSHDTENDFKVLKEEIDRIGKILLRLEDPQQISDTELVDVNQTIEDLSRVLNHSIALTHGVKINLALDKALKPLILNKVALRQILTNLLKNAIEAMSQGGVLSITTQSRINANGTTFFAITLEDNGPGIPEQVMAKLFKPVATTKGDNHSGLGLSVVKKLTDEMHAQIFCSSDSSGTQFKLLFPISP